MIDYIKPTKGALSRKEAALHRKIVKQYPPDFFQVSDGLLLEQYCRAYYRVEENYKLLDVEGEVTTGQRNTLRKNPRLQVIKTYTDIIISVSVKLRLTAQQRKLPQHVGPALTKVRDNKVFRDPSLLIEDWKQFKNEDYDNEH